MDHNIYIISLSVMISFVYAFVAFDFAGRSNNKKAGSRQMWLISASMTMGVGIWGMHFVGLMAFNLSISSQNIPIFLYCMLLAITGTYGAFYFTDNFNKKSNLYLSTFLMGTSIIALHYMGMKVVTMDNGYSYNINQFLMAALILYSFTWLALKRNFTKPNPSLKNQIINSFFMMMALAGLHYMGVISMKFSSQTSLSHPDHIFGSLTISATIFVIVATAFISLMYVLGHMSDRQLQVKSSQLDESEKRSHSLIELNPDGVYVIGTDKTFISINRSIERITGYTAEELIGVSYSFILPPEELVKSKEAFKRVLSGETFKREAIFKHKNGTLIEVELVSIPHMVGDKVMGVIGTVKDLTEIKRVENKIRQSEKLAVVGELAAGVAHEIRNPLTSLRGFTQMFLEHPSTVNKEILQVMLKEIDSINLITSEFMVLAKPHMEIMKPKDIIPIIEQVKMLLDAQGNLTNTRILTEYRIAGGTVNCEENQLKKVFVNLIKNAIEAMPTGGEVKITVSAGRMGELLISIQDEGAGISAEGLKQMGTPFYTTKEDGKGLGLMVSYKIIENFQGTLRFFSKVGEGTRVEISLPALEIREVVSAV